jgi:hypothetical protein
MSLKQLTITNARPKDKPYKLTEGDGLHLLVQPGGSASGSKAMTADAHGQAK